METLSPWCTGSRDKDSKVPGDQEDVLQRHTSTDLTSIKAPPLLKIMLRDEEQSHFIKNDLQMYFTKGRF